MPVYLPRIAAQIAWTPCVDDVPVSETPASSAAKTFFMRLPGFPALLQFLRLQIRQVENFLTAESHPGSDFLDL